jgi:hypothetical protein
MLRSEFFLLGSRVKKAPDAGYGSAIKNLYTVFLTKKFVSKLSSEMFIPDPDLFTSRISGSKKHQIPFPDPEL